MHDAGGSLTCDRGSSLSKLRPLVRAPPLMDDWGKRLRRAASAAKPPAPLQVALARSPPKQTKRACAGPSAVTLPGEGSGGDGVKAQAGQGRAGGVVKRKRCEHGRERSRCKDCGGSGICEHGRQRSRCKDCRGSSICEHGKQRYACKECKSRRLSLAMGPSTHAIGSSEVRGAFSKVVVAAAAAGGQGHSLNGICRHVRNA